jgi:3-oxoadipate enol-lactonase/4-carboxymuconolactone decarboxylase
MVGQWLAINARERLTHLVLANTSPRTGDAIPWDSRRKIVLEQGLTAIVEATMERWFLPETRAWRDPYFRSMRRVFLATDAKGYAACCSAIRDMDFTGSLGSIRTPALVIAGDKDVATPLAGHGDVLAREIPGARLAVFRAAHISNVDRPRSFNAAMLEFLLPEWVAEPLAAGYAARRAALGDEYVDRSIANSTEFTRDFQEMMTRWAWGSVWARPQMDRRTRRLIVLATLAATGRWDEFRLHVRAGLKRELEACDLKEALLAVGAYAGSPAANHAFQIATEEMRGGADESEA